MASEPKSTLLLTIDFTSNQKNKEEKTNKQTKKKQKQKTKKWIRASIPTHTGRLWYPTMAKLLLIVEKLISLLAVTIKKPCSLALMRVGNFGEIVRKYNNAFFFVLFGVQTAKVSYIIHTFKPWLMHLLYVKKCLRCQLHHSASIVFSQHVQPLPPASKIS